MPAIQTTTFKIPTNQTSANEFDVLLLLYHRSSNNPIMTCASYYSGGWSTFGDIVVQSADFEDNICTVTIMSTSNQMSAAVKMAYIPGPLTSSGGGVIDSSVINWILPLEKEVE